MLGSYILFHNTLNWYYSDSTYRIDTGAAAEGKNRYFRWSCMRDPYLIRG
jgi:hypothetical protein